MIRAIYQTGSSLLLKHHNDMDYIFIYDNNKEREYALIHNHDHTVDKHFRVRKNIDRIFLGCYIYPLMKLIEGTPLPELTNFSIFDNAIKSKYVPLLKENYETLKMNDKRWYHIVVAYYMYLNNSTTLTDKQLEVVQNVHDTGISEELKTEIGGYFKWE